MAYNALTLFCLFASVAVARRPDGIQRPAQEPVLNQMTSQGCWDSLPAKKVEVYSGTQLSSGHCGSLCQKKKYSVAIMDLATCYCANTYPPEGSLVDDDKCDFPCPGYGDEACGGMVRGVGKFISVLNTGLEMAVDNDDESSATESATESDATSTTSDISDSTIATTAASTVSTAHSEEPSKTHSEGPSTVADSTSDSNATSTPGPSSSTVPNNASGRLTSPVDNLVRILRNLL